MIQSSLSTFSGTVFTDSNDDGLVDGADRGLGGVAVQLLDGQGNPTGLTAVTAADGSYSFTNLTPGTYSARVLLPAIPPGAQFSPYGSTTTPQPTGGPASAEPNLLTNGSFETAGANTAALGTAGWTSSGNTAATPYGSGPGDGPEVALTNGSSAYAIDPAGGTNPYAGVVTPDSANPDYLGGSGTHAAFFVDDGAIETLSQTVQLTAGQAYEVGFDLLQTTPGENNPGFFSLSAAIGGKTITTAGSLSGTPLTPGVWTHFADLFTPATTGPATLTFSYASGVPGSTLQSKDVLVDDVYVVPGQVTANLTTTSEVNPAGYTTPVTLTAGQSVGNESAGITLPPATIGGRVFADANADGVQGAGEPGLSGLTVNLATGGVITATTVTDAGGNYSFTNQAAGTYTVMVVTPPGDRVSPVGSGAGLDSTVGSNDTQAVSVINGGVATVNAGLYAPATISGVVFSDANADGAQEAGEAGVAGVTVTLVAADGTTTLATTITAANGSYSFAGVTPGADTVVVTPPGGAIVSPRGANPGLPDSTVSAAGAAAVTPTSGSSLIVNAGVYDLGTIVGTVFADGNGDGVQEAGDVGLAGRIVTLNGGSGTTIGTAVTDANGGYSFNLLPPGEYQLRVGLPPGDTFSPVGSSAALPDSIVSATGGSIVRLVSGSTATVNAGIIAPATISGVVFNDANADGAQQAGEAGEAGVTVTLRNGATALATTTTDAHGHYSFAGVGPGTDTVQVVAPQGELFSAPGNSATLPDSTVSAAGEQVLVVGSGSAMQVNAGLHQAVATITGRVFLDAHEDGLDDFGNPAFAGVVVKLYDGAGRDTGQATITDSSGQYSFANLAPGSYQVRFVAPSGAVFTQEHAGVDRTIDSDADPSGRTEVFTLAAGQTDITRNAGLILTGGYANGGVVTGSGTLNGGGNSIIIGGAGPNTIEGGTGTNLIFGGSGPYAQIQGLGSNDIIFGGPGDDLIQGHAGDEFIAAGVGNQTLVGAGGVNEFIANANGGTITDSNGVFSGITGGDTFITSGNTHSIYRAGDGVLTIEDYDASAGDTLQVYGYTAPVATGQVNGYRVLYFGPNAAVLLRANNTTVSASGLIQGVGFAAATPAAPLSTAAVTAANYLTLTEAGASAPVIGPGPAPTITGAVAGQSVADNASITPFSGLVIADPNAGQTETVTVTPFAQDGSFSILGGGAVGNGVYTVSGTPQVVTAALNALVFRPTFHQVAAGQTVTTGFEVTVLDTAGYSRSDSRTSVVATAADIAPTIAGAAANQAALAGVGTHPFATVTIGDPDGGLSETVSVTLSNPAGGALSNLGNGHYDAAAGVFTTVGTAAAATANLDQVVFTPASAGTTGFTIRVADSAGGTAADAATSVTASAAPVIPSPPPAAPVIATPVIAAPVIAAPVIAAPGVNDPQTITLTGWNNHVVVGDGNDTIDAGYGNSTVVAGNGNDSITAGGYSNVVTVGTGADTIDAGSNVAITAAGGSQAITLNGYGNMVFIGGSAPGNSVITGGLGNSQITTVAGSASITLAGYGNVVTTGGANDTIVDGAGATQFVVGPTQVGLPGGVETIANVRADCVVDLIHGAGGLQSAGDAYKALTQISGGARLDLGAGGSVTFLGVTPADLRAANFKIG